MWHHSFFARAGQGGTDGPVLQIPEQAAGGWCQSEDRPQGQLLPRMEVQPLGTQGQKQYDEQ